jgi:hypothetical protein
MGLLTATVATTALPTKRDLWNCIPTPISGGGEVTHLAFYIK